MRHPSWPHEMGPLTYSVSSLSHQLRPPPHRPLLQMCHTALCVPVPHKHAAVCHMNKQSRKQGFTSSLTEHIHLPEIVRLYLAFSSCLCSGLVKQGGVSSPARPGDEAAVLYIRAQSLSPLTSLLWAKSVPTPTSHWSQCQIVVSYD